MMKGMKSKFEFYFSFGLLLALALLILEDFDSTWGKFWFALFIVGTTILIGYGMSALKAMLSQKSNQESNRNI